MLLTFVVPPPRARISGGNLYNAYLIDALERIVSVRVVDERQWLAGSADAEPSETPIAIVDSLYLSAIPEYLAKHSRRGSVLLLAHLLPSHDPAGTTPDQLALEEQALSSVDGVIATSASVGASLVQRGIPAERVLTVPPATSWSGGAENDVRPSEGTAVPRVLLVGNVIPLKSFLAFLHTLAAELEPTDALAIDIVGHLDVDERYAAQCTELARSNAALAGRVTFHGAVPHADMPGFYQRAAVFVSSSRVETFGMALQEARQIGVPVLVHDGDHVAAHVPGPEVGALCANLDELVNTLLALVRDPARLRALRVSARRARLSADYTWERAARSLLDQVRTIPDRSTLDRSG